MRKLIKHPLLFEKTISYFIEQIQMDNVLSKFVLGSISFEKGSFYTLLTDESNLTNLYQFHVGHIHPPNPLQRVIVSKTKSVSEFEWINSIHEEFAEYLSNILKQSSDRICIFDDVMHEMDQLDELLKEEVTISIREEIYYLLTSGSRLNCIKMALKNSQSFWHCLGIVTVFQSKNSEIQYSDLKEICENIEMIITEAYDGEGYIVWEKDV